VRVEFIVFLREEVKLSTDKEQNLNVNPEAEIENMVESVAEDSSYRYFNFLINASNQANLTDTYNMSSVQANVLFVLVNPYYVDSFDLDNMNLNIRMNENNKIIINGKEFNTVEIQPGIRVFGVIENNRE